MSGSATGTDLSKPTAFAQMRLLELDSFGWEDISHHSLTLLIWTDHASTSGKDATLRQDSLLEVIVRKR